MSSSILWIVIIGTSIWMAFDTHRIGYDRKNVKGFTGTGDGKASMSPLRQKLNTGVGIFFGAWAVLALGCNPTGTEPDESPAAQESSAQAPAATPTEPTVAQSAVPERSSEPSAEYKALVAKIMAPNTLGAPMALDAAGLQKHPAHGEMLNMLTQAINESPQSETVTQLNEEQTFAMVYFDCYGDECARRQAKRGGLRLPAKDKAEASAKAQVNTRCMKKHQNDSEWPREVFECAIGEYSALIELNDRMSANTSDIAEIQRLDSCLSRFIRGNKARFAEANACVAKAQGGPPPGYSFAQAK